MTKLAHDERYVSAVTDLLVAQFRRTKPVDSEMVLSRVRKMARLEALEILRLVDDLAAGKEPPRDEERDEHHEQRHHHKPKRPHGK